MTVTTPQFLSGSVQTLRSILGSEELALAATTSLTLAGCSGIESGVAAGLVAATAVSGWALLRYFRKPNEIELKPTDPHAKEIGDYLDDRTRPSLTPPRFIRPFSAVNEYPINIATGGAALQFEQVSMEAPASGHVRLISDRLLDRAVEMVPEFIRTPDPGLPPAFVYARFTESQPSKIREHLERRWWTQRCVFTLEDPSTLKRHVIGEIGLFDHRRESLWCSELLGLTIVGPETIVQMAEYIRQFSQNAVVSSAVYERFLRDAPHVGRMKFSTYELDLILMGHVLRDCAATLWAVLPQEMKQRWMDLFPLEATAETSGVYFRNLLRLHIDGLADSPEAKSFFAQETFSDLMALYWHKEVPQIHRDLNGNFAGRFPFFIDDVLGWAEERRRKNGSAFLLGRTA